MPALLLLDEAEIPKDAKALAIVSQRGALDGKVLVLDSRLDDEIPERLKRARPVEIDTAGYAHHLRGMTPRDKSLWLTECSRAVRHGLVLPDAVPASVRRCFDAMAADAETPRASDDYRLPPGASFDLLPPIDGKRAVHFVAGPSGSGKSFFAAAYATRWLKLNPGKQAFILTRSLVDEDPAYARLPLRRIDVEHLPLDVNTAFPAEGCLVIADDIDAWPTKDEAKKVKAFVDDVLSLGRKPRIDAVVTSHLLANNGATRLLWHESDTFTCFPQLNPVASLRYALEKAGQGHLDIRDLRSAGRAVTLHLRAPSWVLSERMAKLVR